ncbi:outer membrane lipid asymmetry maintenance protein MlaD [Allochromatium vinosum]|uniref:Mammalian cell entry related domain protein n=1 Tax=Allochromatium vinosum (strain ATCC 17899 / DSM 180 / NBRC 103801 / NCIMB 10441 / D) TaxID=572477 RepID=D3RQR1_ALLVD|nr:outer membrane lipid asymmetry maintenance protein MlaD [Allochromatium vinosum]ADC63745.1 Mammalian cell entry related domain protein [Allochromatium vinosum DSM 180]
MAKRRNVELTVGTFVALGLVALFFLAMQVSNLSLNTAGEGYLVQARFANVGSLKVRAPVTMAGVRIGRVESVRFDKQTYEAVVSMRIDAAVDSIPDDTFASIFTAGLLGEQYIGLEPGGSPEPLRDGDEIVNTQSALVLEQMIGQFLFKKAGESG